MAEGSSARWLTILAPVVAVLVVLVATMIAWPLLVLVLLVDLLWTPLVLLRRRQHALQQRDVSAASIVVVSWNGLHFLQRLMPTLMAAVREHGGDHEVIVVDNGSNDGTGAWLQREHAQVKVVALPQNRFFVGGTMAGAAAATRDVLVFLNNDMELRPGFLAPLLDGLRDPRVFAVTAEVMMDPDKRREETGRTRGAIVAGGLKLAHVLPSRDERQLDHAPAFWAGGGSSAFDRRLFTALGGFDRLYEPFYLEDTGLSWQAWKRGFLVLFTARSQVLHAHRGTSRKAFGDAYVDAMIRRNQHLFLWSSVSDAALTAQVFLLLPLQLLARSKRPGRSLTVGLWSELRSFVRALPRLPLALVRRCSTRLHAVRSDREVVAMCNGVTAARRLAEAPLGSLSANGGLKLLLLAARLPRLQVDGSWILFERLRSLAERHRVTLFAFLDDAADESLCEPLRQIGIEVVTAVRRRNPMPGNWHGLVPNRLHVDYAAPAMAAALRRAIEGTDFDLVQVEYIEMAHLLQKVRAAIPAGVPVIYTCHESMALAAQRQHAAARGFLARMWSARRFAAALRQELRLLRTFDHVVALNDAEAGWLKSWSPGLAVTTVPSGIDIAASERDGVEEPATILFVGYFKHEPNVDAALWLCREVLPRVQAAVPQARIELVGREAPASLEHLAVAAGSAVTVRGFVPDLQAAMARATVVAVPLRQGGGLRGKVLEAWAAGRPVVATGVALEGFAAESGRNCLRADDAVSFSAALVRCLCEPALRSALGGAGRELVRTRYSCAAMAAGHEAVYRQMLARGKW